LKPYLEILNTKQGCGVAQEFNPQYQKEKNKTKTCTALKTYCQSSNSICSPNFFFLAVLGFELRATPPAPYTVLKEMLLWMLWHINCTTMKLL
jgi:hypothetical protein